MLTLRTARGLDSQADHHAWVQTMNQRINLHPTTIPPPDQIAKAALLAIAYANHGAWVADCPDLCGGAEVVEPSWPFMCCRCGNTMIGGLWRRVRWPKNRRAIDRALDARPFDRFRHWVPGEEIETTEADTTLLAEALGSQDPDHPLRHRLAGGI